MNWFNPVPLGAPQRARRVGFLTGVCELAQPKEPILTDQKKFELKPKLEKGKAASKKPPKRKKSTVLQSKSLYFKKGQRLQYKKGKGPKKDRERIFVVVFHGHKGILFGGRDVLFSEDFFEPVD
ncbi:MAG: hypothetical protein K9M10_00360 [Candidatus Pacebacteria bacterium]|nr:hypothetical protein [Candidatus Paceibacterota bacterium]MCF7856914.1 hypothetical protein [Candidatus Paceibacterota bacterium]